MTPDLRDDVREAMVASIRRGLGDLGGLGGRVTITVDGRAHDGTWLAWLPSVFPELLEKSEPYEVPADLVGPETVPWLTARDMRTQTIERWWSEVFTYEHAQCSMVALIVLREMGKMPRTDAPLTDWAQTATPRQQADLWNRAMQRLGYTEDA